MIIYIKKTLLINICILSYLETFYIPKLKGLQFIIFKYFIFKLYLKHTQNPLLLFYVKFYSFKQKDS